MTRITNIIFGLLLVSGMHCYSQFYNKEIKAEILVEQDSEFYIFKAIAENMTPSGYNLNYEFMVFSKDIKGNTSKSSQSNGFFMKANEKLILARTTINYNEDSATIIVLSITDLKGKPLGQDRIELPKGGKTTVKEMAPKKKNATSADQTEGGDGFELSGLVIENTITKIGRDFYRYFYNDYYNRGIKASANISIKEVPGRGRTTMVSVLVGDKLVWRFFSQPRKKFLKKMAQIALQRTIMQLQKLQKQKNEFIKY